MHACDIGVLQHLKRPRTRPPTYIHITLHALVPSNKPSGSSGVIVVCIEQAVNAAKTTLQSVII